MTGESSSGGAPDEFCVEALYKVAFLIQHFLTSDEKVKLSMCCSSLQRALRGSPLRLDLAVNGPRSLQYIKANFPKIGEKALWEISGANVLDFVELRESDVEGFQEIFHCAKVEYLSIRPYPWKSFKPLLPFSNIKQLKLLSCEYLRDDLSMLSSCQSLQALYINSFALQNLNGIEALPRLQSLTLAQCLHLADVRALGGEKCTVQRLTLIACTSLEDISPLRTNKSLTSLSSCSCSRLLTGFDALKAIAGLKHYSFNHGSIEFDFACFAANTNVVSFAAIGNHCLDLNFLIGCTNIVKVDLSYSYNLESVEGIASCAKIETVLLRHCRQLRYIDDLLECKCLRELYLKGCRLVQRRIVDLLRELPELSILQ